MGYAPQPVEADHARYVGKEAAWVARSEEGTVLGVLEMEPDRTQWLVYNVAVDPRAQGRRIGPGLLAFAEDLGRTRGFAKIALYTSQTMARNIEIYQHLGYRISGTRPNPRRPGRVIVDMEKGL